MCSAHYLLKEMLHVCRVLTAEAESDQLLSWLTAHCHDESDLLLASTIITTTLTTLVIKTGEFKERNLMVNLTKLSDKITVTCSFKKAVKISQKLILLMAYAYTPYSFCNKTLSDSFSSSCLNKLKF